MYDQALKQNKDSMIQSLQELIKIKSVREPAKGDMPFGEGIQKSLEYILALGEKMGFKTKNIDNYAGYIEFGEGKEMIGVLCHLDVVPEGDNWTFNPYGGEISEGKLYGRGTLDNKGPAIASLYAMKTLKDSGFIPKKRIRLILGTNEESGSACIKHYLSKEEKPSVAFSPDADFPVIHGEMGIIVFDLERTFEDADPDGGIEILSLKGGNAPNMVPDYAEAKLLETKPIKEIVEAYNATRNAHIDYTKEGEYTILKSHGISAHGSTPEKGVNAISQLVGLLDLIDIQIGDQSNFIRFLANHIGMDTDGKNMGVGLDDAYNALVLNLGMIDLDQNSGKVTINIRYPITLKELKIKLGIDNTVRGTYIEMKNWKCAPPLFFPPSHPLVETLMNVYREKTGDIDSKPITIGGGTYARSMPNAVAFGALFPGAVDTMHQKDEYIVIDDLYKMTDIFTLAIKKLSE
ncbi:dipeptidase PepV [Fusibacter bizertensis]|uniref:Dipeptidase PepV n=1 Tax=Fusibacter bizertensis TaxID=1488331 RepID=A0ABT6NDH9_9FIRM|nr:dipeptidase PepV [Fusibacter bizertensis]MDH8678484.1 dipeptidase PepV [Fusibacter bizertensis]